MKAVMKLFSSPYRFAPLCLAALLAPLAASAVNLQVVVADGPATPAVLYVALFDSAEAYVAGKSVAAQTLPVQDRGAQVAFLGLPPGDYALKVFADENGNGKLDTNLMGIPTERYGFSKDARGNMSAPGFEAASIRIEADLNTTVHLR
jgi:uncharacterized protein (DUF2141 family)